MKRKLYITVAFLACSILFSACDEWFDISPKTDVKAKELFETENGYLSSLAGIYVSMTEPATYGGNLSFGMLDQLVQMYDMIPDGAVGKSAIYKYNATTDRGYNTKGKLASIWLKSYRLIANANNLLKWLDENGEEVIPNDDTRNMIRGEALAIRAFVHFDLLRCWGPINYAGDEAVRDNKSIPYRVVADNSKQPLLKASEVVGKIIEDLKKAQEYLSYEKDLDLAVAPDRRFRFNYHAVMATLARVYNYAGDKENAMTFANEVIKNCGLELQDNNFKDPVLFKEMICGLNLNKMQEVLSSRFSEGGKITNQYYTNFATIKVLFQVEGSESDDFRAKSSALVRYRDEQKAISKKYIDNEKDAIPLIRLPEMYYIMSEASPLGDAVTYVNKVRNKRGISTSSNVFFANEEDRTKALRDEYRKEFYAEGKYFFFLKHKGYIGAIEYSPSIELIAENYVFPLPDAEKEYGWTANEENDKQNK